MLNQLLKKITLLFFFFLTIPSFATVVQLTQKDSVCFNFITTKMCYGNSATLETRGRKFQIGVFDLSHYGNDSIKKYGFIAIYKLDDLNSPLSERNGSISNTFFEKFDVENFLSLYNLKYLVIEGEQYEIADINLNSISINKLPELNKNVLKNDNYLDCVYDLSYFNGKYTDSNDQPVNLDRLFKPQMLNVIYYTMNSCQPCEKIKFDMAELATGSKINLNIVIEEGAQFDEAFDNLTQKFFYNRRYVKNNLGYPTVLLFDGKGIFIKTINHPKENIVKTIYSYAAKIK